MPVRRRQPVRRTAAVALLVSIALAVAGCDRQTAAPADPRTDEPTPVGTFEEAALIALGEMFRTYGTAADPVPTDVTGEIVTRDGQPVWRIDGTYEVTVDGERRADHWTLWIGTTDDAPLAVLSTAGPR